MNLDQAVLRLAIADESDVFLARQRGREVAALAGLDNLDQVRVATAISELSRELTVLERPATLTLSLTDSAVPALLIETSWAGELPGVASTQQLAAMEGVTGAARLTDTCTVNWRLGGGSVALTKKLPAGAQFSTPKRVAQLREACRRSRPGSALDVLRSQNLDLLNALESLQTRQEDLLRANAELEETNRGVMALHAELSDELEQTNRGVVALYAELDEASKQLREASESKTRFWANVSHELRTPINSVLGLSRLLLDPGSEPLTAEQHYQIELINDSAALLLTLVNELLDVAKAESGRLEAHLEQVDLRITFDRLRSTLRPMATNPEVTLVVENPEVVGLLWTDPVLLGRILRNLIANGLKFTERGEVRCSAQVDSTRGYVNVIISDTGIGIPPEHQQRVFEEFHQVPGRMQARTSGTGLGLPYARRLAEILGGSLELDSAPGKGTVVTLRLPMDAQPTVERPARFGTVLVVEDDPAFRAVLYRALALNASRVTEVGDGVAALRALQSERPDLVVLDLHIPPPAGAAVLTAMRQNPDLEDIPVVVVTSAELDPAVRGTLAHTAAVLDKAHFSTDLLLAATELATRLARLTQ